MAKEGKDLGKPARRKEKWMRWVDRELDAGCWDAECWELGSWKHPENAVKLKNVLAKINENGLRISTAIHPPMGAKSEVLGASGNFYRLPRTNENVPHK